MASPATTIRDYIQQSMITSPRLPYHEAEHTRLGNTNVMDTHIVRLRPTTGRRHTIMCRYRDAGARRAQPKQCTKSIAVMTTNCVNTNTLPPNMHRCCPPVRGGWETCIPLLDLWSVELGRRRELSHGNTARWSKVKSSQVDVRFTFQHNLDTPKLSRYFTALRRHVS